MPRPRTSTRRRAELEGEIARLEKKLANEGFVEKAPPAVVDGERAKLADYQAQLDALEDR